jgi:hypothetical protein
MEYFVCSPELSKYMQKKLCLLLAVLLAAVFSISLSAQTKAKFVSQDGGFTIDLPREGYQGVEPVGDLTSGAGTYAWVTDDGQFSVSYLEGVFSMQTADQSLDSLANVIVGSPANRKAKILERHRFVIAGNPVIELRIQRPEGLAINRLIMVKRRLYVLTADWVKGDGTAPAQILDSFQLFDSKMLIA